MLPFAKAKRRAQQDANAKSASMCMYKAGNGHWMHMPWARLAPVILRNPYTCSPFAEWIRIDPQ